MKIPKYINELLIARATLAERLDSADHKLSDWLKKNEVCVEEFDTRGGYEMYFNPWDSARRIAQAIEDK